MNFLHLRSILQPNLDECAGLESLGESLPHFGRLLPVSGHCRRRDTKMSMQIIID